MHFQAGQIYQVIIKSMEEGQFRRMAGFFTIIPALIGLYTKSWIKASLPSTSASASGVPGWTGNQACLKISLVAYAPHYVPMPESIASHSQLLNQQPVSKINTWSAASHFPFTQPKHTNVKVVMFCLFADNKGASVPVAAGWLLKNKYRCSQAWHGPRVRGAHLSLEAQAITSVFRQK